VAGNGRHRDCRGDANEDQQRRHQKSAADTEHAGDVTDREPHPQNEEDVHRQIGDGKIDLQVVSSEGLGRVVPTGTPRLS